MTATKGLITAAATTALDTRKSWEHWLAASAAGSPRIGVLGENASIVTSDASTAPMRVAVAKAGFATQRSASDGVAFWGNDGSIFVTVTKPGSNSWYVAIYAKHNDTAAGDADNLPTIGAVTGSASATPSVPSIPAGALLLATVLIPSTATSTQSGGVVITNVYPMTAFRGGIVPVRNSTELAAWTPADGGQALQLDTDATWRRDGGAWVFVGHPRFVSASSVLAGTAPGASDVIIEQAGTAFPNTNGSGDASIVYPTAFPNGVISVQLERLNFSNFGPTTTILNATQSLSQANFRIYAGVGSALASATGVPFAWRAVGW